MSRQAYHGDGGGPPELSRVQAPGQLGIDEALGPRRDRSTNLGGTKSTLLTGAETDCSRGSRRDGSIHWERTLNGPTVLPGTRVRTPDVGRVNGRVRFVHRSPVNQWGGFARRIQSGITSGAKALQEGTFFPPRWSNSRVNVGVSAPTRTASKLVSGSTVKEPGCGKPRLELHGQEPSRSS